MAFKGLRPISYGGREVWPLIEGGKGVSATNHTSSGAWAAAGGIGTVSAVNADSYDAEGKIIPQVYHALTRRERHEELVRYAIDGAVEQVKRAYDIASGKGAININVLWEMGGGAARARQACSNAPAASSPASPAAPACPTSCPRSPQRFNVNYLPIISSARAFRALWKRAYHKVAELLAAVVYEDPWLAGGHNGLSNAEDPHKPEDPYPRVLALRDTMRESGISDDVPIIMAGGVWYLREWEHWIDNPELGPIAFQFGTRPLLTEESPIPRGLEGAAARRSRKATSCSTASARPASIRSAVRNSFLRNLEERSERQIAYSRVEAGEHTVAARRRRASGKNFWVTPNDLDRVARVGRRRALPRRSARPTTRWSSSAPPERGRSAQDQAACMGCLSRSAASPTGRTTTTTSTGRLADPRSFCIQKTLQDIAHGGSRSTRT